MKSSLIYVLSICCWIGTGQLFAAESPADAIQAMLDGFSKGDVSPLISRLSDTDRKLLAGVQSYTDMKFVKSQLNLDATVTEGWQEYEYRVAYDYIHNYGVVKKKKDAALEKAYQLAFIRDQWIKGDYSEVDLVFPLDSFKYSPSIIRFMLFRENGAWKISSYGSMFLTASMMMPPMILINPFVVGDFTDFHLSYVYGEDFLLKQKGDPGYKKFSLYRRLQSMYSAAAAKVKAYAVYWAATGDSAGTKQLAAYKGAGRSAAAGMNTTRDISHERSKSGNPYLKMPLENQLDLLRNPFSMMPAVYSNFIKKAKDDEKLATKARFLLAGAYLRFQDYSKAAETYEILAANSESAIAIPAKKALVKLYLNELKEPQKAELYMQELGKENQLADYELPRSKAPLKFLSGSASDLMQIRDFEIGPDGQTLYILFWKFGGSGASSWVENRVVEYRVDGSSNVIYNAKNDNVDSSSYCNLAVAVDGLWVFGNSGHAFKINYEGKPLTYVTDLITSLQHSSPLQKLHTIPNIGWGGAGCEDGKIYIQGHVSDRRGSGTAYEVRGFDEITGALKESIKLERNVSGGWGRSEMRKKGTKILIPSPRSGEVFVYDYTRMKWKYIKNNEAATSLEAARGMAADMTGNLYVAMGDDKKVFIFSKNGEKLREFDTKEIAPEDIAVDAKGNVYVVGVVGSGEVAGVRVYDHAGVKISGFDLEKFEHGMARYFVKNMVVTQKGTIFLNIGKTVRRYNAKGTELDRWERRVDGNIYMAPDNISDSVYIFPGNKVYFYKGPDTTEVPGARRPEVYRARMSGDEKGVIHGYDSYSGVFNFAPKTGKPEFKAANAKNADFITDRMLVDTYDNIWQINGPILRKWDEAGKEIVNKSIKGRKTWAPISLDYDSKNNFFVADMANKRILAFARNGKKIADLDVSQYVKRMQKIRMDRNGNLYLLDSDLMNSKEDVIFKFENILE